jgi:hypothetical protein
MRVILLQEYPVATAAAVAVAVVGLGLVLQVPGSRAYGDRSILEQIAREDGTLCGKFGFESGTEKFTACLRDLTDVRARHVDLLKSYYWL